MGEIDMFAICKLPLQLLNFGRRFVGMELTDHHWNFSTLAQSSVLPLTVLSLSLFMLIQLHKMINSATPACEVTASRGGLHDHDEHRGHEGIGQFVTDMRDTQRTEVGGKGRGDLMSGDSGKIRTFDPWVERATVSNLSKASDTGSGSPRQSQEKADTFTHVSNDAFKQEKTKEESDTVKGDQCTEIDSPLPDVRIIHKSCEPEQLNDWKNVLEKPYLRNSLKPHVEMDIQRCEKDERTNQCSERSLSEAEPEDSASGESVSASGDHSSTVALIESKPVTENVKLTGPVTFNSVENILVFRDAILSVIDVMVLEELDAIVEGFGPTDAVNKDIASSTKIDQGEMVNCVKELSNLARTSNVLWNKAFRQSGLQVER